MARIRDMTEGASGGGGRPLRHDAAHRATSPVSRVRRSYANRLLTRAAGEVARRR